MFEAQEKIYSCLTGKLTLAKADPLPILNRGDEFFSNCS